MRPLVTIVTPSLNQGPFIRATIESVLGCGYEALEYIVMDGGSTDETAAIAAEYTSRLTFISEPDHGQAHAINKGFGRAHGGIVAWINSDDLILPGAVGHAVRALCSRPGAAAVYGEGWLLDETGTRRRRFPATEPFNLWKLIYVTDYILQQSVYFRKDAVAEAGWLDESLHYGLDWDLLIRLGKRRPLEYIPEYLGCLREYPAAKSFAGGKQRWRELAAIARRHGRRNHAPAEWQYGLVTYGDRLPHPLRVAAHLVSDRIVKTAQGLDGDGNARRTLRWALPAGSGEIAIRGCGPVRLQTLGSSGEFGPGEFEMRVRADSAADFLEFEVHADRRWRLRSIDWLREDPIDPLGE